MWLAWSLAPQDELESARAWANPRDRGEIKDDALRKRILAVLSEGAGSLQLGSGHLILAGANGTLVSAINIRHD